MRPEALVELFFPEGLLKEFDVVRVETTRDEITVHLDEKAVHPELTPDQKAKGFYSKGFTDAAEVLDFPIRDRLCRLMVRKRKWKVNGEKKLLMRPIELNEPETRYTKGFAAFLKEAGGA